MFKKDKTVVVPAKGKRSFPAVAFVRHRKENVSPILGWYRPEHFETHSDLSALISKDEEVEVAEYQLVRKFKARLAIEEVG